MNWLTSTILASAFISGSNALTKYFQPIMNSYAGMLLFSVGVCIASSILFLLSKSPGSTIVSSPTGLFFALLSGAVWGIGQLLFILALAKNAPLSLMVPIVVGGIGVGGVIAGILFFHESISLYRLLAITLVILGSVLLARS